MAPPPRPPEAVIEAPPAVPADATPEQQLTHALASFQAEVSPIAAADLAEVVHSARPAFRRGIGWSAHLREQQGRSRLPPASWRRCRRCPPRTRRHWTQSRPSRPRSSARSRRWSRPTERAAHTSSPATSATMAS